MDVLNFINRSRDLFEDDISIYESDISSIVQSSSFLIIGAAGSIGTAVTKEIFSRNPKILHVVDLSENNLVELVRNLRSTFGYIDGDFKTFAIDCGGDEFVALMKTASKYDFVLNLSALKHVRNEKDPFTLMRMIRTNILNTIATLNLCKQNSTSRYFCVSTDKATNPVNMMGASKRIMEMFLARESQNIHVSTARFANVAFSDGSLLHGFRNRIYNQQPLSAPNNIERYFLTPKESGQLCISACLLADNMETFFPKLSDQLSLTKFSEIAVRFLDHHGFEAFECESEDEARSRVHELIKRRKWPVYFFCSDTTGEKASEEFYTANEKVDLLRFPNIGVIEGSRVFQAELLDNFENTILKWIDGGIYDRQKMIALFNETIENFNHLETGKFLDDKM